MNSQFDKLMGTSPRPFSFHAPEMGLSSAKDILQRIAGNLNGYRGASPATVALLRKFAQSTMFVDQAVENLEAIEAALNSGNAEAVAIFDAALAKTAETMAAGVMQRFNDHADEEAPEADEEDCSKCDDASCAYHPSKVVAAAASAETEDDSVRFISETEDEETAGARRLAFNELPPELQGIIGMLERSGARVHAFGVNGNPSH